MRRSPVIALKLFVCSLGAWAEPLDQSALQQAALEHNFTGVAFYEQARYAEAEAHYRKAIALQQPFDTARAPLYAASLNNLATVLQTSGKMDEARKLLREVISLEPHLGKDREPLVTRALISLALIHQLDFDLLEAERLLKKSLSYSAPNGSSTAGALHNIAAVYFDMGREKKAEETFNRALEINQTLGLSYAIPPTLTYLARLAMSRGDRAQAESLLQRAISIRRADSRAGAELAVALSDFGELKKEFRQYDQAVLYFEESLAILKSLLGDDHLSAAPVLFHLGHVRNLQGRYAEALALVQRSATILERSFGPNHGRLSNVYKVAAEASAKLKRKQEAKQYDQRAKAVLAGRIDYGKHTVDVNSFLPGK